MTSLVREIEHPQEKPLRPVRLGARQCQIERKPDGTIFIRSPVLLASYPDKITERLEHWAAHAPGRLFLAQRQGDGWRKVTFSEALAAVRRIAAALLTRDLSPERPILVLSGNDIDHALLGLAAAYVGIPYAPISPAYSLLSSDHSKLKHIAGLLTPGLVFAADGQAFAKAIYAAVPADVEIVVSRNLLPDRRSSLFADLAAEPTAAVDAAHTKVGPDTIGKILFTSGSTGMPKGVINTQRMMSSNQAMSMASFAFVQDEPPVIVDWLPWSHTFGGNHNFNLVLFSGGTLYIDDGKPLPGAINETVRNLREIATSIYFNVPKGYEMLLPHLRADSVMRETFFSRLKVLFYAGASLAQHVWDELEEMSYATLGERVIFLSSIGSTETAPLALSCSWDYPRPGNIGLPTPGVELKLVPADGKLEARLRGPNITPGYWRQPELTATAFDDDGFYKIGDTLKFADAGDPSMGLLFDGRIAEDFKLATGTWVSLGALRVAFINHFAPYVRDVVIAGPDRDDVTALVFPDIETCRKLAPELVADTAPRTVLADEGVRRTFAERLRSHIHASTGSSNRVCRIVLLDEPPSMDAGEMTDKGSINQRAVLKRRAALVEDLYKSPPPAHVIAADA
jgi:feruloyl-CoA synthase